MPIVRVNLALDAEVHEALRDKKNGLTWEEYFTFLSKRAPSPCKACLGEGRLTVEGIGDSRSCPFCEGSGVSAEKDAKV